ncbi:MAG: hypothetical protein ACI90V_009218 [Bacillariaceae sp.]
MSFHIPESSWDTCYWDDRSGTDFMEELNARAAVSEQLYYEKVILLECLADACKENSKKDGETGVIDPNKVWSSLALVQRKLFADQVQDDSFQRTGPSVVISKIDRYILNINDKAPPLPIEVDSTNGNIVIPAASFKESNGNKHVRSHQSFGGGTQLHLNNGEGYVTYEIPEDIKFDKDKEYILIAKVSTVHKVQHNLKLESNDGKVYEIKIPYTIGEWQDTKPTFIIKSDDLSTMKFRRKKAKDCFGLAIKSFTLTPWTS